jgi:chromosome segregation ATPase
MEDGGRAMSEGKEIDIWSTGIIDDKEKELLALLARMKSTEIENERLKSDCTLLRSKYRKKEIEIRYLKNELALYVGQINEYEKSLKYINHMNLVEDMVLKRRILERKREKISGS